MNLSAKLHLTRVDGVPGQDMKSFQHGLLVWAKLGKSPWWPAVMVELSRLGAEAETVKKDVVWLYWFGDHLISQMKKTNVVPFMANINKLIDSRQYGRQRYENSLLEILQIARDRAFQRGISALDSEDLKELIAWAQQGGLTEDDSTCIDWPIQGEELPIGVLADVKKICRYRYPSPQKPVHAQSKSAQASSTSGSSPHKKLKANWSSKARSTNVSKSRKTPSSKSRASNNGSSAILKNKQLICKTSVKILKLSDETVAKVPEKPKQTEVFSCEADAEQCVLKIGKTTEASSICDVSPSMAKQNLFASKPKRVVEMPENPKQTVDSSCSTDVIKTISKTGETAEGHNVSENIGSDGLAKGNLFATRRDVVVSRSRATRIPKQPVVSTNAAEGVSKTVKTSKAPNISDVEYPDQTKGNLLVCKTKGVARPPRHVISKTGETDVSPDMAKGHLVAPQRNGVRRVLKIVKQTVALSSAVSGEQCVSKSGETTKAPNISDVAFPDQENGNIPGCEGSAKTLRIAGRQSLMPLNDTEKVQSVLKTNETTKADNVCSTALTCMEEEKNLPPAKKNGNSRPRRKPKLTKSASENMTDGEQSIPKMTTIPGRTKRNQTSKTCKETGIISLPPSLTNCEQTNTLSASQKPNNDDKTSPKSTFPVETTTKRLPPRKRLVSKITSMKSKRPHSDTAPRSEAAKISKQMGVWVSSGLVSKELNSVNSDTTMADTVVCQKSRSRKPLSHKVTSKFNTRKTLTNVARKGQHVVENIDELEYCINKTPQARKTTSETSENIQDNVHTPENPDSSDVPMVIKFEDGTCIGCNTIDRPVVVEHPLVAGRLCLTCEESVLEGTFLFDEDGNHTHCCICGKFSPWRFLCTNQSCKRVFCQFCVVQWFSASCQKRVVMQQRKWKCTFCSPYNSTIHGRLKPRDNWQKHMETFFFADEN